MGLVEQLEFGDHLELRARLHGWQPGFVFTYSGIRLDQGELFYEMRFNEAISLYVDAGELELYFRRV